MGCPCKAFKWAANCNYNCVSIFCHFYYTYYWFTQDGTWFIFKCSKTFFGKKKKSNSDLGTILLSLASIFSGFSCCAALAEFILCLWNGCRPTFCFWQVKLYFPRHWVHSVSCNFIFLLTPLFLGCELLFYLEIYFALYLDWLLKSKWPHFSLGLIMGKRRQLRHKNFGLCIYVFFFS